MNVTTVLASCLLVMFVGCSSVFGANNATDLARYLTRFGDINLDQALHNERGMYNHIKCFLNEGPCVQMSRDLKRIFPVLSKSGCIGCSDEQIESIKTSLSVLKKKWSKEWDRIVHMYDPPSGANLERFVN
ncbi:Insect odorant-binding protein A10/Ejaculatory bulb-specific protein 3 [Cinara cedri]|uniref:Insect odorant-binding protein A10/Ejaculatory bulb-specific protein 3 n=1 Tax=Cinara cedri TaxID=506608 RepID=A0A5E4MSV9_9HEMI|nr:Insect odorant-binding protein A10/Ejaculatory bulb-specific protein 3 [Cinara cedri]